MAHIDGLPNELLISIHQQALDLQNLEIELPICPGASYLNRYTPLAKSFRAVCRRWKDLVDLPSNYLARMTAICFVITPTGFKCGEWVYWDKFRSHAEQPRSLLAVRFHAPLHFFWLADEKKSVLIEQCLQEIHFLSSYEDHLVNSVAQVQSRNWELNWKNWN